MKNILRILLLTMMIGCWSCGSGEEDVPTPTPTPKPEEKPKIEVTTTAPVLEQAGGTASVTFTSTADWTIDVTEGRAVSWCNVSPTSGSKGTNTLTITTTGNDTYDERNAKITIKAGATNQTFTITQKQKDGLTVTSNKVEIGSDGGNFSIETKTNVSVTYEIEESAKDWISASESRGLTTKTLNFTAKANDKTERRQGNIVLKGGDGLTETVTVYQAGEEVSLVLTTEKDITIGSEGGNLKIELQSNSEIKMEALEGDWLRQSSSRSMSAYTYYLEVDANDTYDERNTSITFTSGDKKQIVTVTQKQKDALIVTSNKVEIYADGGDFTIEAKSNVSITYEIEESAKDWISAIESRGLTAKTLNFTAKANDKVERRQGNIILKGGDGLTETVTVYQAGEEVSLVLTTEKDMTIGSEGGTLKIELQSNSEIKMEALEADWLRQSSSRSMSAYTYYLEVDANDTYDERNASITFTSGDKKQIVTVTQKQKDALIVTSNKVEIGSDGGDFSIEAKANVSVTYEIEESAKDWISASESRGLTAKTLNFTAKANDKVERRQGNIILKGGDGLTETVTVYQAGEKPTLVITSNDVIIESGGETVKIELKSNVDYTMVLPNVDWISQTESRAMSTYTHYLTVAPNESYDQRSAKVFFQNEAKGLKDSISITQMQLDAIILAKNEYIIEAAGGNLDIKISSNVDFEVSPTVRWIKQNTDSRALEEKTLSFTIEENTTGNIRSGILLFTVNGILKQRVYIKQKFSELKTREALIAFFNVAGGDQWVNNENWCSDRPLNEWYGISADSDERVREISLSGNNLSGDFSVCIDALLPLKNQLNTLYLEQNRLLGYIPESIGEFVNLSTLDVSSNQLSGELPAGIAKTKLVLLNLSDNLLSGDIYHLVPKLPYIAQLLLEKNHFTGRLPEFTEDMEGYCLSDNLFTGDIPESHVKIAFEPFYAGGKKLYRRYEISGNNLSGEVPVNMRNHSDWHAHWREILPQKTGYGFNRVDLPAPQNVVKCYDGSFLDLGEEYKSNQYTIIFRWDPYCLYSQPYILPIYKLYQKYKEKGLGLVCTTHDKLPLARLGPLTSVHKDIKIFWEESYEFNLTPNVDWNNNPFSLGVYFYLFRSGYTPCFHIVDNSGNIVFYGDGDFYSECIPQYHENRDEIFDFVANLFGDEKYEHDYYTSTDYSRDGEVVTLQTATVGKGINLTFMGEAFVDKVMETGGLYEHRMKEAMEKSSP